MRKRSNRPFMFPEQGSFSLYSQSRQRIPTLPFREMKNFVLGEEYALSVVFIGSTRSRELNVLYRKKNKPANVLSFPLEENEGEIYIDLLHAKGQAGKFSKSYKKFVGYLFIHGMLHLKGMQHGSTMEQEENRICSYFSL